MPSCTLIIWDRNKTENSEWANTLVFNKVGQNLQKSLIFVTILLTFSKNSGVAGKATALFYILHSVL